MDAGEVAGEVWERIVPAGAPQEGAWSLIALAVALAVVVVPVTWRLARPAVTIAHELGHAGAGLLAGRRFTGFVVSADMSGHAVTVGPRRGIGRIVTTWAGYPAPAVLGTLLVQVALRGWAGTALFATLVVLLVSLVFTRSLHTVVAVLSSAVAVGAVWWWGDQELRAAAALGAGVLLLMGAWRHLGAVVRSGSRGDDPAQLAELTPLPAWVWNLTFVVVVGACTWWAWTAVAPNLPSDLLG